MPAPKIEIYSQHQYMKSGGENCRITFAAKVYDGYDWACYVCASVEQFRIPSGNAPLEPTELHMTEEAAVQNCLEHGNKLPCEVAHALFPYITEMYRE